MLSTSTCTALFCASKMMRRNFTIPALSARRRPCWMALRSAPERSKTASSVAWGVVVGAAMI
jgi:hypothetical protein